MSLCHNCGAELEGDFKFCPECGAENIDSKSTGSEEAKTNVQTSEPAQEPEELKQQAGQEPAASGNGADRTSPRIPVIWILIGILVVAAIAGGIYLIVANTGDDKEATTEGTPGGAAPELIEFSMLQDQVGYSVLVPTYLPDGFKLNPASINITDHDEPGSISSKEYQYVARDGIRSVYFGGNMSIATGLGMVENTRDGVRGHQALVYTLDSGFDPAVDPAPSVTFEDSESYAIFWLEGADVSSMGDYIEGEGRYSLQTKNLDWEEVLKILDGLQPVSEAPFSVTILDYPEEFSDIPDVETLYNNKDNLGFEVLVPTLIPEETRYATIRTDDTSYSIRFTELTSTELKAMWGDSPIAIEDNELILGVSGDRLSDLINCSKRSEGDNWQQTTVDGRLVEYSESTATSEPLASVRWCTANAIYMVYGYVPLQQLLDTTASMTPLEQVLGTA